MVELLEAEGIERGVKMFFTLTYQPGFLQNVIISKRRKKSSAEGLERMCILPAISVLQRIGLCQNDR
ncbi:MAG: hypothetical protein ACLR2G_07365 [Phascolarctobacterium faecium]